ncbi:hypothetical protein AB9M62_16285 [Bacillales bacterium AN1005]|uniref:hypothetical protein n=1 Tax=Niallia taxi TaxID=2499688 RepID=UPI0021A6A33A|nr:hypothetical protein [Niallia taxi]MCT2347591.1 hypothetical protein [Niallia taxi]
MKKTLFVILFAVLFTIAPLTSANTANASEENEPIIAISKELSYDELDSTTRKDLGEPIEFDQKYTVTSFYQVNDDSNKLKARASYPVGVFTSTIVTDKKNKRTKTIKWTATSSYHTFKYFYFLLDTGYKQFSWKVEGNKKLTVTGSKKWTYKNAGIYKISINSQAYFNGASPATLASVPTFLIVP